MWAHACCLGPRGRRIHLHGLLKIIAASIQTLEVSNTQLSLWSDFQEPDASGHSSVSDGSSAGEPRAVNHFLAFAFRQSRASKQAAGPSQPPPRNAPSTFQKRLRNSQKSPAVAATARYPWLGGGNASHLILSRRWKWCFTLVKKTVRCSYVIKLNCLLSYIVVGNGITSPYRSKI